MSGAQSVSKPVYFKSTHGTKTIFMEAERLYTSAAYPQGNAVKPRTYSVFGQINNAAAKIPVYWTPNGYKSYEPTTQWMAISHQVTWTDPSSAYKGRWYFWAKSLKAKRQSNGAYTFQGARVLPSQPERGSWSYVP